MVDAPFLALSVLTIAAAIASLELRSLIYGSIALMGTDRKSTRLNSSHIQKSRMPSSA